MEFVFGIEGNVPKNVTLEFNEDDIKAVPVKTVDPNMLTINEDHFEETSKIDENSFMCSYCSKIFPNAERLSSHVFAKHSSKIHPDGSERLCPLCNVEYHNKKSLMLHFYRKHRPHKFVCKCGQTFALQCDYNQHIRRARIRKGTVNFCSEK